MERDTIDEVAGRAIWAVLDRLGGPDMAGLTGVEAGVLSQAVALLRSLVWEDSV